MTTKLEMAHEYAVAMLKTPAQLTGLSDKDIAIAAFNLAEAMQAEADKRENEKQSEHVFEAIEEWQPDWSQAPADATAWEYLGYNAARWHTTTKGMYKSADLFGFSGIDMLILKRPE